MSTNNPYYAPGGNNPYYAPGGNNYYMPGGNQQYYQTDPQQQQQNGEENQGFDGDELQGGTLTERNGTAKFRQTAGNDGSIGHTAQNKPREHGREQVLGKTAKQPADALATEQRTHRKVGPRGCDKPRDQNEQQLRR